MRVSDFAVVVFAACHSHAFQTPFSPSIRRNSQTRSSLRVKAGLVRANSPRMSMGIAAQQPASGFYRPSVRDSIAPAIGKVKRVLLRIRLQLKGRFASIARRFLLLTLLFSLSGPFLGSPLLSSQPAWASYVQDRKKGGLEKKRVIVRTDSLQYRIFQEHQGVILQEYRGAGKEMAAQSTNEDSVSAMNEELTSIMFKKKGKASSKKGYAKYAAITGSFFVGGVLYTKLGGQMDEKIKQQDLELYGEFISPEAVEKDPEPEDDEDNEDDSDGKE